MWPVPTDRAVLAFAASVLALVAGVRGASPLTAALGGLLLIGLAGAFALTVPMSRRVRSMRLELAWSLRQADAGAVMGGYVVPGVPLELRCFLRSRHGKPLMLMQLSPVLTGPAEMEEDGPTSVWIDARARTEFRLRLHAQAAGRVVLHGLAAVIAGPTGLFAAPLYFANPLTVKVFPRSVIPGVAPERVLTGLPLDRAGRHRVRRHGGGTELHEIREFMTGDPYRSIAWKASARAGRLLVRENEQEVQQTDYLLLDVAGSMREGSPGGRPLDNALELAAAEARKCIARGDSVGIITLDGRMLAHLGPDDGSPQLNRVYDLLLGVMEVVDADLTTGNDAAVARRVGRYLRFHEGLDFSDAEGWDVPRMTSHIQLRLRLESTGEPPLAESPRGVWLRAFCRHRGLPLEHRALPVGGDKAPGIVAGLRAAGEGVRVPRTITLISDLRDVRDMETVTRALRLLRRRGHDVQVRIPGSTSGHDETNPLGLEDLTQGHNRALAARRVGRQLRRQGVTIHGGPPGLSPIAPAPQPGHGP